MAINRIVPLYKHDCHACLFVGNLITENNHLVDPYLSCEKSNDTWIMRYSSEGADYCTTNDPTSYLKMHI